MSDGNALIGTKQSAPRQLQMALASWQSYDYYNGIPYPTHAFGPHQWPKDKGPIPTPLPYVQTLISEGAEFTFRNGSPVFSVPDDPDADVLLQEIITSNALDAQWIALAEANGNQGALAAKFSIDLDDKECPIRIDFLDVPQECRIWVDPHDSNRILMARIQYPYRDATDGRWYYHREEWTEEFEVKYTPALAGQGDYAGIANLPGYQRHLGDGDDDAPVEWQEPTREPNHLGLIPITIIPNRKVKGNPLGEGDCWRHFRLVDRLALTMHGEDLSNQFHFRPATAITNGNIQNDLPLVAGEMLEINNNDPNKEAKIEMLEPSGRARQWTQANIDKWEDLLYKAVGLSRVNPQTITNKGNMTELAFVMTFARSIATSDRKRELWGQNGMCRFFSNLLVGLKRLGGVTGVKNVQEGITVSCEWPSYFQPTPQDVEAITNRTTTQVEKGFLPRERGAERIARAEKIPANEIKMLLDELKNAPILPPTATAEAPTNSDQIADIADASGSNNFVA